MTTAAVSEDEAISSADTGVVLLLTFVATSLYTYVAALVAVAFLL